MGKPEDDMFCANQEVRLTDATIAHLSELMGAEVRKALKDAITDEAAEKFWGTGIQVFQKQATQRAGQLVLGGFVGLFKKTMLFVTLGMVVYAVGGWTALLTFVRTTLPGSGA